jgi:hypothetical protein
MKPGPHSATIISQDQLGTSTEIDIPHPIRGASALSISLADSFWQLRLTLSPLRFSIVAKVRRLAAYCVDCRAASQNSTVAAAPLRDMPFGSGLERVLEYVSIDADSHVASTKIRDRATGLPVMVTSMELEELSGRPGCFWTVDLNIRLIKTAEPHPPEQLVMRCNECGNTFRIFQG